MTLDAATAAKVPKRHGRPHPDHRQSRKVARAHRTAAREFRPRGSKKPLDGL